MTEFEIEQSDAGNYYFILRDSKGNELLRGEKLGNATSVKSAISLVRINSPYETRYRRTQAPDGTMHATLRAGDGSVLGQTPAYASRTSLDEQLQTIKNSAPQAPINEHS